MYGTRGQIGEVGSPRLSHLPGLRSIFEGMGGRGRGRERGRRRYGALGLPGLQSLLKALRFQGSAMRMESRHKRFFLSLLELMFLGFFSALPGATSI